MKDNKKTLHLI